MSIRRFVIGLLACSALCVSALAQSGFYLKDGDTVVFYGDSITDQRLYTTFTETYVVTRFPKMKVKFVHSGWGGDRVTGGGGGPIDVRLQRDVFAYKPTVMTIMLGMNDGHYMPFDEDAYNTFTAGYKHIVDSVKSTLPGIRITAIQPSPYDDVNKPPTMVGGYNAVLVKYGEFIKQLAASDGLSVADLNAPVVADLMKARLLDGEAGDKLIRDRVHPGAGGHLLMAKALLKAWNAPALVSLVEIDGATGKLLHAENAEVSRVSASPAISWDELDAALPLPLDMKDPGLSLAVRASDVQETLDNEMLRVKGLPAKEYRLSIDKQDIGTFTADQLSTGVNLSALPTPMSKQAADVHALTLKHNNIHFARWRSLQVPLEKDHFSTEEAALESLDRLENEMIQQQHSLAVPTTHHFQLTAVTQ